MTPDQLQQGWQPARIGRRIQTLTQVDSTNRLALQAADQPDTDGLAIFADHQTGGRGRQGRSWISPWAASVLCSVLIIPNEAELAQIESSRADSPRPAVGHQAALVSGRLTLVSAVATCQAIDKATEITPAIKWPNDVRVSGKKLGGILIESCRLADNRWAWVIGVGLNCLQQAGHFPPDLKQTATSLELLALAPIDRLAIARQLLRSLDDWLSGPAWLDDTAVHETWMSFAEPIGQRVQLRSAGHEYTGLTLDVDPAGGLIVQCDDGRQQWFDPMITTLL